jgi:hypothetical protein
MYAIASGHAVLSRRPAEWPDDETGFEPVETTRDEAAAVLDQQDAWARMHAGLAAGG